MHLCFWGGLGLSLVAIYSYLLNWIPYISTIAQSVGGLPVIVTGSGVIIIVGVVQDLLNKTETELVMAKYEKY
jgi:preprotein translocase subunit SecY